jgi:transketolase
MAKQVIEATRDSYGQALLDIAKKDKNVVVLDCDLCGSTRSIKIKDIDPERFFEMGIAEQDMISTAAGMAYTGKIVFVNSFAVFITGRAFDQIRQQVALPEFNVKICGSSAGITQGPDGATHQSIVDVSLMRSLPNMVVIVPADAMQTKQAVFAAHSHQGPVYLRLSRYETEAILPASAGFSLGKAIVVKEGKDVVLASCGPVLKNVITASKDLSEKGISAGIVNFHTIKPLDAEMVRTMALKYKYIVSVEEHSIYGGLGSAIAEELSELDEGKPQAVLRRIGVKDMFGESGTADELLQKHGLDPVGIMNAVLKN